MQYAESISAEEISQLKIATFPGPIGVVVEKNEDFAEAMEYLSKESIIGFDTETKPCFVAKMPRNNMALLQLSGADKAYIFRLQSLGLPLALAKLLSDPKKIKVGAAIHDDIKGLQGYRKFLAKNFIDLQKIGIEYGIKEKSVRKMAAIILGVKVSKSQQLSNWEAVQLSGAQAQYAAIDAWVCREMY